MVTVVKVWDGNERVTERGTRVYVSQGRWQWTVEIDGQFHSVHDTAGEAKALVARLYHEADAALTVAKHALAMVNTSANREAVNAAWAAREAVATPQKRSGYASRAGRRQAHERGTK